MLELAAGFDLGPIDQVSFAVESIEAALPLYTAMFGAFTVRDSSFSPDRVTYRGRPVEAELRLAFARSGDVEIELVEILSGDGPSLEHIRRHGPGLHHVRFEVDDLASKVLEMAEAGFEPVLRGASARGSLFAYLEMPERLGYSMIELIQQPAAAGAAAPERR